MKSQQLTFALVSLMTVGISTAAQAAVTITGQEAGGNVSFEWSGQIDLTGLGEPEFGNLSSGFLFVRPGFEDSVGFGAGNRGFGEYRDALATVPSFNLDILPVETFGETIVGDFFGFLNNSLFLPSDYVSNASIDGSGLFLDTTFVDLNIDASQSYEYPLINGDTVTLQFTTETVPEPSSLLYLIGYGSLMLGGAIRKTSKS